jgi:hypothetical protein
MTEIVPHEPAKTPATRRPKPVYFADGFYSMQSDRELEQFGMSSPLPPPMRLYLLAASRVNKWGHCPFRPGELLRLLGVSRPTLRSSMRSLQAAKMAAPDSTALCVVLSAQAIRRADRSERRCAEPKHLDCQERMWVHSKGWEPHQGFWHETLNNPDWRQKAVAQITQTRTVTETTTVRFG